MHDGTGGSVDRGATITNTLANLKTFLNASVNAEIAKCVYDVSGTTLTITSKTIGTTMNSYGYFGQPEFLWDAVRYDTQRRVGD